MTKIMMGFTTCMRGLQKFHAKHPHKSLQGFFICNGRKLSHDEVLKVIDYAVEHGYETEQDIHDNELKKLLAW